MSKLKPYSQSNSTQFYREIEIIELNKHKIIKIPKTPFFFSLFPTANNDQTFLPGSIIIVKVITTTRQQRKDQLNSSIVLKLFL